MSSDIKKNLLTLDTAFIIAILTGLLYVLSFLYYAGQFYYYKVPLFLIEISIKNIINSMLHFSPDLIIFSVTIFSYLLGLNLIKKEKKRRSNQENNQVSEQSRKNKKKTKGLPRFMKILILISVISLLSMATLLYLIKTKMINSISIDTALIVFFNGGISSILIFISILLYRRKNFLVSIGLVFILLCGTSFFLGHTSARESKTYIVVEDKNKTFVSLAVYDDQFVLSPINLKTKEFSNKLKLMEIKDVKEFKQQKMIIKLKK